MGLACLAGFLIFYSRVFWGSGGEFSLVGKGFFLCTCYLRGRIGFKKPSLNDTSVSLNFIIFILKFVYTRLKSCIHGC